jgi:hypothetical protein
VIIEDSDCGHGGFPNCTSVDADVWSAKKIADEYRDAVIAITVTPDQVCSGCALISVWTFKGQTVQATRGCRFIVIQPAGLSVDEEFDRSP